MPCELVRVSSSEELEFEKISLEFSKYPRNFYGIYKKRPWLIKAM